MPSDKIELFLHLNGKRPQVIHAESKESLRALLSRLKVEIDGVDKIFVFVGECDAALQAPEGLENGADKHIPADLDLTLVELDLEKHRHIHCHRCPEIDTTIFFSRKVLNRKFSPATTVEVATRWTISNLRLDPKPASEFVLQIYETTDQPRPSQHLGELVNDGECALSFELVKEMTPQG